jgi:8-oxo-dGTP pyrophosphatase MutT (NUDIX family)
MKGRRKRPVGAHVVLHRLVKTCNGSVRVVLLYKRTHDAPIHAGHWALFGGKLGNNEEPKDAVKREVQEELGIEVAGLTDLCDVRIARADGTFSVRYFRSPLDVGIHELSLQPNPRDGKVEGEGLAWFDAEEIHHLTVRPEDRIALNEFFKNQGA